MTEARVPTGDAVRFGWKVARQHLGFFVIILIVVAVINWAPQVINLLPGAEAAPISLVVGLAFAAAQVITGMGLIRISLRFADSEQAEFADLFAPLPLFFRYLIGTVLVGLIVFVGLLLLIVPGIVWGYKYLFTPYLIVDKGLGPRMALRQSAQMTAGVKWGLVGFSLALLGLNLLGALALLVGLLLTIPASWVAFAYVYRRLLASQAPAVSTG